MIKLLLIALLLTNYVCAQSAKDEDRISKDFLWIMNDIQTKLMSDAILTKNEKKLLFVLHYAIEKTNSFSINSNSATHTITFNKLAWISIYKYLISLEISKSMAERDEQTTDLLIDISDKEYNRRHYFNFYNFFLKWLPTNVNVIEQAELDSAQVANFNETMKSEEFKWLAKRNVALIYFHEFFHQVQNINVKRVEINKISSRKVRDSLFLNLEMECDSFALYKAYELHIFPEDFFQVYDIIETFSEDNNLLDIEKRRYRYFQMLLNAGNYFKEPYLKYTIGSYYNGMSMLHYDIFELTTRTAITFEKEKELAEESDDAQKLFDVGYAYLTNRIAVDTTGDTNKTYIDSALVYFKKAGLRTVEADSISERLKEKSLLCAAKIYELIKRDTSSALPLISEAKKISLYFPKNYYDNLLKRITPNGGM